MISNRSDQIRSDRRAYFNTNIFKRKENEFIKEFNDNRTEDTNIEYDLLNIFIEMNCRVSAHHVT